MIKKLLTMASIILLFQMSAQSVFASGSTSIGSGTPTSESRLYNIGKGVYARKIICSSCPYAGQDLNKSMAEKLLMEKDLPELGTDEKKALKVFLQRKFKI